MTYANLYSISDARNIYSFINIEPKYKQAVDVESFCHEVSSFLYYILHSCSKVQLVAQYKPLATNIFAWEQQTNLAIFCGIPSDIALRMFAVNFPQKTALALHLYLVIKTPVADTASHYDNVNNLLKMPYDSEIALNVSKQIPSYIYDNMHQLDDIHLPNYTKTIYGKENFLTKYMFFNKAHNKNNKNCHEQLGKSLKILYELTKVCDNWIGSIDIVDKKIVLFHQEKDSYKIKQVYQENINNNLSNNINNNINEQITLSYTNNLIGIPFIDTATNRIDCYQYKEENYNRSIVAYIGYNNNKYTLSNYISYIKILENIREHNMLPNSYYLSPNKALYNLLIQQDKYKDKIIYLNMLSDNITINIFDTPLGSKNIDAYLIKDNLELILNKNYSIDHRTFNLLISEVVKDLYTYNEQYPKIYNYGDNEEIDQSLPENLYKESYFEISKYYMRKNNIHLSRLSHCLAMPVLDDIKKLLINNHDKYSFHYEKLNIDKLIEQIDYIIKNLPYLNKTTNLILENNHIYFFDTESTNNDFTNSVLTNLVIYYITAYVTTKNNFNTYSFNHYEIDSCFSNYYKPAYANYTLSVSYDRLTNNMLPSLIYAMRESKKLSLSIELISSMIDNEYINYITKNFNTSRIENESWIHNKTHIRREQLMLEKDEFIYHDELTLKKYKFVITKELLKHLRP